MWNWVRRLAAFIGRDVADPNESKKNAVMTRCICVVMSVYIAGQTVFMLIQRYYMQAAIPAVIFLIYALALYLTYFSHSLIAYYLTILMILGWCFEDSSFRHRSACRGCSAMCNRLHAPAVARSVRESRFRISPASYLTPKDIFPPVQRRRLRCSSRRQPQMK